MNRNINSRLTKLEHELDYSYLNGEQLRRIDVRRLTSKQIQSLDVLQLSDEQVRAIGFEAMTDSQIDALARLCPPEIAAIINAMSDEELQAVLERRLCPWYPGYKPDLSE